MFHHANKLLSVHKECLDLRGHEVAANGFKSATSGFMTLLLAIHLCDKVTVFGLGEAPMDNAPYQVRTQGAALAPSPLISALSSLLP